MTFAVWLLLYLAAQVLCYLFCWTTFALVGLGPLYGWVFGITNGLILVTVVGMAWETLWDRKYRLRTVVMALLISGGMCRLVHAHLGRPAEWFDWMELGQSLVLLWAGIILGLMATHVKYSGVALVLASYWTLQGLFGLGYILHYPNWAMENVWIPPAMGLFAFTIIGLLMRKHEPATAKS